jgi:Putative auto-transporter adhesin, head GIN domain
MRKAILVGLAAAAVSVVGCTEARSADAGPTTERDYKVGDFDRVELAGAYDANIRTGAAPSVHAKGGQNVLNRLVVEVKDGALLIHPKDKHFSWGGPRGKVQLTVTVPSLRGAELAGAGNIHIDRVSGNSFNGAVAGAGDLRVERVEVQNLQVSISGAGNAQLLAGRAQRADYDIAGSGGIDAKGVQTETASVSIAGSGDVDGRATKTADVSIVGSGEVRLTGGAKCSVSKAGAGNVSCS